MKNGPRDEPTGYGRPPVEHQFKKGVSGNPKGRPKRPKPPQVTDPLHFAAQPANQIWLEEAYRPVTIREDGKSVTMPLIQAVIRRCLMSAASSNDRFAQRAILQHVGEVEKSIREGRIECFQSMLRYKSEQKALLEEAAAGGYSLPEPVPHPDDIILDLELGIAHISGPRTEHEKAQFELLLAYREDAQFTVTESASAFARARKGQRKQEWLGSWKSAQRRYDKINDNLPKRYRVNLKDRCRDEDASRSGSQQTRPWPGE